MADIPIDPVSFISSISYGTSSLGFSSTSINIDPMITLSDFSASSLQGVAAINPRSVGLDIMFNRISNETLINFLNVTAGTSPPVLLNIPGPGQPVKIFGKG